MVSAPVASCSPGSRAVALAGGAALLAAAGCGTPPIRLAEFDRAAPAQRLDNLSPWYAVDPGDLELHCDWTALHENGVRRANLEIPRRAVEMIEGAQRYVIFSFFLFDNFTDMAAPDGGPPLARPIADAIIRKRCRQPETTIVLVLDRIHEAWGNRRSPIVDELVAHGVDVFYSDVLDARAAWGLGVYESINELGRAVDPLTGGLLDGATRLVGAVPLPGAHFDGAPVTLNTIGNALYFKANHRKLLVCDEDGQATAMVTSWNPHDPSALNENHAVVVRGDAARYTYMVARADIERAIEVGGAHVRWSSDDPAHRTALLEARLPALPAEAYLPAADAPPDAPRVAVATEGAIEAAVLDMLDGAGPGDAVRIQMFYLSRPPVLHAILDAARRGAAVRILLDPNEKSFNNGTPNVQSAEYLLERARDEDLPLEIRWRRTSGEQNHAKAMSITSADGRRHRLTVGSANWTRKGLTGINLEANVFVENAPAVNRRFDELFDRTWSNRVRGAVLSLGHDEKPAPPGPGPWRIDWAIEFVLPALVGGEPVLIEREMVHW